MARPVRKSTWREARDATLQKKHDERSARIEKKKTWKEYAIIAGGTLSGILLLILWITYANWAFRSTYEGFLK